MKPASARALEWMPTRAFTYTVVKRTVDVVASAVALLLLSPLFAVVAVLIKRESLGPVFFKQERMGRGFQPFAVYKFRTMRHDAESVGPQLTVRDDPRITPLGALLRRTKIDEFPQLLNVLKGEMSLVGPRPEVRKYVERFPREFERILRVRPGVTDAASFKYRGEAELLSLADDPEREYIERILPDKLRLADDYVEHGGLVSDLTIMLKTLIEAVGLQIPHIRKSLMRHRRPMVVVLHLALSAASNYAAFWLRFDGRIPAADYARCLAFLPLIVLCRSIAFIPFRLFEGLWRYAGLWDLWNIVLGVGSSSVLFFGLVRFGFGDIGYPRAVFFVDGMLAIAMMGGMRLMYRGYHELIAAAPGRRVLVFGAGDAGEMIVREVKKAGRFNVIGFIDDDVNKVGRRIHGVPVLGTRLQLERIMAERRPHEVLVAVPRFTALELRGIVAALEPYRVPIRTAPNLGNWETSTTSAAIRNLTVEDLLVRAPAGLDRRPLERLVAGRRVLVTGAAGTIGAELTRQIIALHPSSLVLVDRDVSGLWALASALGEDIGPRPVAVVADVTDRERVDALFAEHTPEVVFHAAAHSHVPLMEQNPCEAVRNNVLGTRIVAEAAVAAGVNRFVLISTDDAVNPTSVMGATRRVAELCVQQQASRDLTAFITVRLDTVLGRAGAPGSRFVEQIKAGGPVTIPHAHMRRFFTVMSEAATLLLHAAAIGQNGETFVFDMGEQIKAIDMARDAIRLAGLVPGQDVQITITGLRPGDKLSEELVGADEMLEAADVAGLRRVRRLRNDVPQSFAYQIAQLERSAARGQNDDVIRYLTLIVPFFTPHSTS